MRITTLFHEADVSGGNGVNPEIETSLEVSGKDLETLLICGNEPETRG